MSRQRLTPEQKTHFKQQGYLTGLPVFDEDQVRDLNEGLAALEKLLKPGESTKEIREWHESSRWLYDICMNEQILDYVEDLLSPNFFLWASNYLIKEPHSPETVAWHQDGYYWPLHPVKSLTVWIACTDSDLGNGAMQVIPGSHTAGLMKHNRLAEDRTDSVLFLECEKGQFREDSVAALTIQVGQISIHDDKIVHGSPGKLSDAAG